MLMTKQGMRALMENSETVVWNTLLSMAGYGFPKINLIIIRIVFCFRIREV